METHFTIRSLTFSDIPAMHKAFLKAFSDYVVDFTLTEDKFIKKFVEKLNIDFEFSAGAFWGQEMVGFIFTNIGMYNGLLTAYNGGSGVIPQFRGRNLTVQLYRFLIEKFRLIGIVQCILEVLTNNKPAIKSYDKVGFTKNRYLKCFKLDSAHVNRDNIHPSVEIITKIGPDWKLYESFADIQTSYLDHNQLLSRNMINETLIEALLDGKCMGYGIYQGDLGRISQFGVHKDFRRMGIGTALLAYMHDHSEKNYLTVLNIDKTAKGIIRFLKKMGFANQINQYEMIYNVKE